MIYVAIKDLRTGQITLEPEGRTPIRGLEVYMARMTDAATLRALYPKAEDKTKPPAERRPAPAEDRT